MKRIALTLLAALTLGLFTMAQEAKKDAKIVTKKETFVRVKPDKKVIVIIHDKKNAS